MNSYSRYSNLSRHVSVMESTRKNNYLHFGNGEFFIELDRIETVPFFGRG